MPKKKTRKEDIQRPEHYFAKWLYYEKRHYETTEYERKEKETSLEALEMTDREVSFFNSVNQHGELYVHVEGESAVFGWMEEIRDERLYQIIVDLSYEEKYMLTLRIYLEWSHKEVAVEMGMTEVAVRLRFSRLMKKIKKLYIG